MTRTSDLSGTQVSSAKGSRSRWTNLWIFGRLVRHRFIEDGNFQMSAALTYNTLFSLLPTFVLALLVISMISGGSGDLGQRTQQWIVNQMGINQIQISTGDQGEPLDLAKLIGDRIQSVRALVASPGTGLIAFAALLWGALGLMIVIERAFNRICRLTRQRPWVRRLTLYWCVLTLGPIGVAISLAISQSVENTAHSVVGPVKWLVEPMGVLASFFVSWMMVFLAYRIIPETSVRWRSALIGALVGAALWESGKYAFGMYVRFNVGTKNWYGNLALLPLFMLWIYWTWNFLLLGLQIAHIHERFPSLSRHLTLHEAHAPGSIGLVDFRWVLPVSVMLYRRFQEGHPLRADDAAQELGISPEFAQHLFSALQRTKLVHCVEGRERTYALARPPDKITSADILAAARTLGYDLADSRTTDERDPRGAPGILELESLEQGWASQRTLADLAGDHS